MKKTLTILTILFCCVSSIKAQYVNIPDANFKAFLQTKYPTAFNGAGLMDTTNSLIVGEDSLDCNSNNITSIDGVQYFDNLKYFNCSNNKLNTSLVLPNSLIYLNCSFNLDPFQIIAIPNSLIELHFRETSIDTLPTLPNTLKVLEGVDPDIVGASLMYQGSSLKYITNIPSNLEFLALGLCPLQVIPNLPNTLKDLHYSDLTLGSIPAIPTSVKRFSMYIMPQITNYVIPNNLEELFIDKNNYTVLPFSTLPNTIRSLGISDNKLTQLPKLPDSLYTLYCSGNNTLTCLPILPPKLAYADFTNTLIVCLPNMPNGLTTLIPNTLPVCNPTNNPNNCPTYNYVNIPDTNFGKFLIAKYPTCLYKDTAANKYYMDTTCGAVVNEKSLDCSFKNISDLSGIQYFDSLKYLNCNNNQVISLPNLPINLVELQCNTNYQLSNLPNLPASLMYLDCSVNQITNLPALPKGLVDINCSNNSLHSLPVLPKSLFSLECSDNPLNGLPILPDSLNHLLCMNNGLTSLPNLPNTLMNLRCFTNKLTSLPILPISLNYLACGGNNIFCLPYLPKNLLLDSSSFDISKIKCLPNAIAGFNYPVCNSTNNPNNCPTYNYVNIPDTNFGKFLIAKYPTCLYKDANNLFWMDTTCGAVVNETIMNCGNNMYLKSIVGIQYFKKMKNLDCSYCEITTINNLPNSLETLNCSNNIVLTSLAIPDNLKVLLCSNNGITYLPQNANHLISLDCNNTGVSSIATLPNSLEWLNCSNTQIQKVVKFPSNLKTLFCGGNYITDLPSFPNNLESLNIEGIHWLTCLPTLPNTLNSLNVISTAIQCLPNMPTSLNPVNIEPSSLSINPIICSSSCNPYNPYVNIPDTNFGKFLIAQYPSCLYKDTAANKYYMDTTCGAVVNEKFIACDSMNIYSIEGIEYFKSLQSLICYSNKITTLSSFSNSLLNLDCSHNNISTLSKIPDSLETFNCSYNYITSLDTTVGYMKYLREFDCSHNFLVNLPKIDSIGISPISPRSTFTCGVIIDLRGNNIQCLPKIPQTPTNVACGGQSFVVIYFDTSMIKCIPNYTDTGLFINNQIINYPICNPTNNPNQCHIYPSVSGKVFTDNNSNAVKDTTEFYRPFVKFSLSNGQISYSNLQGVYGISVDTLGTYTLKVTPPPYFKAVPDSVNITFAANTSVVLPDIALQPIATVDSFAIHITKLNLPRPGFKYTYNVSYGNVGTISSTTDDIIVITYDSTYIHFDSASVPVQSINYQSANTAVIELNLGKLIAGQGGSLNLYYTVKTSTQIGDTISTSVALNYTSNIEFDIDETIVVGSHDPNDKTATPTLTPQQVQNGDYIDYTIRFQNTGNANATNIVIADTLSSLLQFSNIQIVASSHNSNISYRVGNGIIYFEFLNINLPYAAANEPLSHGFVSFRVKALPTLVSGAIVPNTASIYFDYNAPIVTNTATTQIKAIVTPVRIISYELRIQNSKLEIQNNWQVGVEINVSHYVIQRSTNGKDFTSVGEVAAQGLNSYSYIDKLPTNLQQTIIYYRLKIVDKDGKLSYSEIKTLNLKSQTLNGFSVYPNPAKDIVNIEVEGGKQLLIIDAIGKTVYQSMVTSQWSIVNVKEFNKGVYLLRLIMNNGEVKTSKLIIE